MPEVWLIDGFNLLHELKTPRNQKLSKEAAFHLLANFASFQNCQVLMVLDGIGIDSELDVYQTSFFQVCYSQKVTADSYIEKYLCQKKIQMQAVVVTRDQAVTRMARGSGARVMEPQAFIAQLHQIDQENDSILFKNEVKSHGFNRPFEGKL